MEADREYFVDTLGALVRINSINPAFSDGSTNESEAAGWTAKEMERLGMSVRRFEAEPGRASVVGVLPGSGGGRSLMLYAHLDTVGIEGMPEPFAAEVRDGKMYGRGAYDMKAGLAAALAAVKALRDAGASLAGDVLIAAVADEEVASIGMQEVLRHVTADAAIVTEPTELEVGLAHKGFSWIEVETFGRAAHGSQFGVGIDANLRMGRFLARLDALEQELRNSEPHPLVGPPSLHAAVLNGGTGASTYAAHCRLTVERRMVPGETEELVVGQLRAIADALAEEDSTFRAEVRATLTRDSFEVPADAAIVRRVLAAAAEVLGRTPVTRGFPFWMDAAFLAAAGVETVVIGGSGAGAHETEEWVDIESHVQLATILARTAASYCAAG
ncbi:M20/M25/M40 family metallo-hydrolase [Longimicrobium sp.]|uniref:M20/M25/M40 family metallo-hydrolase n=1 Tax=Longimicrobium sp. TaxID=2029185 RepID=UPI002C617B5A|nr:M20/M25/M40 family metallo-hydrolase [Longimicrobium sp.]HSU14451.1 M20/M25/M40 family metallo-hydrolase [Longimicrobium sp.]